MLDSVTARGQLTTFGIVSDERVYEAPPRFPRNFTTPGDLT